MKRSLIVIGCLFCVVAVCFALWPAITLELAKRGAIRKLSSPGSKDLNTIPSLSTLSIPHLNNTSLYSVVQLSGCEIGLPDSEFRQHATDKALFLNSNLVVAFFRAVDKSAYASLERELGRSNVFDFVSSAYRATVTGISEQKNMVQLQQYLALILYKATVAPVGSEHSWLQFDSRRRNPRPSTPR